MFRDDRQLGDLATPAPTAVGWRRRPDVTDRSRKDTGAIGRSLQWPSRPLLEFPGFTFDNGSGERIACGGQVHPRHQAVRGAVQKFDRAAMRPHDVVNDRKSESEPDLPMSVRHRP